MINIIASEDEINLARNFANIYDEGNYGRNVLNVPHEQFIRFIFLGKLTELVVKRFFIENEISVNADGMLEPEPGEFRIGPDMILNYSNQTIDVKAAVENFHTRLLVREDQFQAHVHDIYIGTKCVDDLNVQIYGYAKGDTLRRRPISNFGTGPCRGILLRELEPIENLIGNAKLEQVI